MISKEYKNAVFIIALPVLIVLLLGWYIHINYDYPYYFIWDMDYIVTLDIMLIQSGLLPDHIDHTGYGMHLFLVFSQKIAHFSGIVSLLNMNDVANSINPLAGMAELTDFFRLHSPFLAIGIAVFLCMSLQNMFSVPRRYILIFLAVLGTQESLTYHSTMIRTEFYSVFYFSLAVLILTIAVKTAGYRRRLLFLVLTGILAGLSFFTKIQSLFYVSTLPLLLVFFFSVYKGDHEQEYGDAKRIDPNLILYLSLVNVIVFAYLARVAYSIEIHERIRVWASSWGVTPISFLFSFALISLFAYQLLFLLKKKTPTETFDYSVMFSVLAAGFLLSIALHFLLYSNINVSMRHILHDFKVVFLGRYTTGSMQFQGLSSYVSNLLSYFYYNPFLFIVNITLTGLVICGHLKGFVKITRIQLLLCLFISAIAFINIAVGTRFIPRDILWVECLVNFLSLFYFSILISRALRYRIMLSRLGGCLLIVMVFVNCLHTFRMPDRLDANYNHYGWWEEKWFIAHYHGNQPLYRSIIKQKFENVNVWPSAAYADHHRKTRRIVNFVFKNQDITHRNIGIVSEGFSAWSTNLGYRLSKIPEELRNAILVDNASIKLKRNAFFKEEYVSEESGVLGKIKKGPPSRRMSVLTRSDLKIFMFVTDSDAAYLVSDRIVQTPFKIALQNEENTIELQGLEIKNYSEIPIDSISQEFFFAIPMP